MSVRNPAGLWLILYVGNIVLRDRQHLAQDGLIVIVLTMDSQTGNTSEQVQWNTCTCIGEYAKTLSHYLKSGTFVVIQGRVLLNQWVDKVTQEKRSRTVIGIDSCTFVETVKRTPQYQTEESEQPAPQPKATRAQPAKKTPAPKPQTPVYDPDLDADLPF